MGVIRQQRSRFLDYLLPGHAATVLCWQVIENAANATALRAHQKFTFGVEKARASYGLIGHQLVDRKASYAARRRAIFPSGFEGSTMRAMLAIAWKVFSAFGDAMIEHAGVRSACRSRDHSTGGDAQPLCLDILQLHPAPARRLFRGCSMRRSKRALCSRR
jgi:hypothetical protein